MRPEAGSFLEGERTGPREKLRGLGSLLHSTRPEANTARAHALWSCESPSSTELTEAPSEAWPSLHHAWRWCAPSAQQLHELVGVGQMPVVTEVLVHEGMVPPLEVRHQTTDAVLENEGLQCLHDPGPIPIRSRIPVPSRKIVAFLLVLGPKRDISTWKR